MTAPSLSSVWPNLFDDPAAIATARTPKIQPHDDATAENVLHGFDSQFFPFTRSRNVARSHSSSSFNLIASPYGTPNSKIVSFQPCGNGHGTPHAATSLFLHPPFGVCFAMISSSVIRRTLPFSLLGGILGDLSVTPWQSINTFQSSDAPLLGTPPGSLPASRLPPPAHPPP